MIWHRNDPVSCVTELASSAMGVAKAKPIALAIAATTIRCAAIPNARLVMEQASPPQIETIRAISFLLDLKTKT